MLVQQICCLLQNVDIAVESAEEMDVYIIGRSVNKPGEIKSALKKLLPEVDALWLIPDPIVIDNMDSAKMIFDAPEVMTTILSG